QPCPQRRQREVWVGLDVYRQRTLLRWRQLARPVPPSRTGAPLAGPAAADQRLVNVGHADPQQCRRSARRHAAVNRRENPLLERLVSLRSEVVSLGGALGKLMLQIGYPPLGIGQRAVS